MGRLEAGDDLAGAIAFVAHPAMTAVPHREDPDVALPEQCRQRSAAANSVHWPDVVTLDRLPIELGQRIGLERDRVVEMPHPLTLWLRFRRDRACASGLIQAGWRGDQSRVHIG